MKQVDFELAVWSAFATLRSTLIDFGNAKVLVKHTRKDSIEYFLYKLNDGSRTPYCTECQAISLEAYMHVKGLNPNGSVLEKFGVLSIPDVVICLDGISVQVAVNSTVYNDDDTELIQELRIRFSDVIEESL